MDTLKLTDISKPEIVVLPTSESALNLAELLLKYFQRLWQPWTLYQILILLTLAIISYSLVYFFRPKIRKFLGLPHGFPKWFLRFCVLLTRRLHLIIFMSLSWGAYLLMQFDKWPSHSYIIYIAAGIITIWTVIAIAVRLIKNKLMRIIVKWVGWIYFTLKISGLWDAVSSLFHSMAIETGGHRISILMIITALITLTILFGLASFFSKFTAKKITKIDEMSPSIKVLFTKAVRLSLYGIAFLLSLSAIGFDLSNLALLSGAMGLGIGFGLQKIVSNLVSGIIILLDKSIKPGDVISLDGTFGWITQLGARYASITTRDGREYLVPNEDFITNQVINWTHSSDFVRLDILFGVAYDSDPHFVKEIAAKAPLSVNRVVNAPSPVCHIINFGDSSIDFKLRFWIKDPTSGLTNIRGDVYLALWDALKNNNISIPFPRRDVHMYTRSEPEETQKLPLD